MKGSPCSQRLRAVRFDVFLGSCCVTVALGCCGCVIVCVVVGSFESGRMLHETCVGADAGERRTVLFRVEWLQSAMKGTLF